MTRFRSPKRTWLCPHIVRLGTAGPTRHLEIVTWFAFRIRKAYSITTVIPFVTIFESRITSQFAVRMQPWLWARPMVCGLFVP